MAHLHRFPVCILPLLFGFIIITVYITMTINTLVPSDDILSTTIPSDVLINTYMRSGSSFLGRVLGWRNDSFYMYEPLWKNITWKYYRSPNLVCKSRKMECEIANGTSPLSLEASQSFLHDVYHCKLEQHLHRLFEPLHTGSQYAGHSWNDFRECRKSNKSKKACISTAIPQCLKARHRVTKVLRMSLESVTYLLENNPRLKVIQLFRDPRAIIGSRLDASWFGLKEKAFAAKINEVKVLCSRMTNDITSAKGLLKVFPGRLMVVQYESLNDTLSKTDQLYKFLGMSFSEKYKQFVLSLAQPVHGSKEGSRGKPGFHPFSYRQTLDWQIVKVVNEYCSDVYKELGLVKFTNERDLRDNSIGAINKQLTF